MQLRKDTWAWFVRGADGIIEGSGHKKRRLARRAAQALFEAGYKKKLYLVNENTKEVEDFKPYSKDTFNQKQKKEETRVLQEPQAVNP